MKWLTNIYNPYLPDSREKVSLTFDQTQEQAWQDQQAWLKGKIIGEPKPTDSVSVEALKAMNYVGIYIKETTHEQS